MSYNFDASNRNIEGTLTSQYDSEGLSIVAWVKMTATEWGLTNQSFVVHFSETLGVNDFSQQIIVTRAAADRASARSRTTADLNADNNITAEHDDVWQVLIALFTSDFSRELFVGDTGDAGIDNTSERAVGTALDAVRLGASSSNTNNLPGLIAEVAMFNKTLSNGEIDSFRTASGTGPAPNTVAPSNCFGYWPLLLDQSSHSNEGNDAGGTLTVNSAVWSSDHPTITTSSVDTPILVPMGPIR